MTAENISNKKTPSHETYIKKHKAQTSLYQHAILVRNPVRRLQQGK
jgi:hypothetical protein